MDRVTRWAWGAVWLAAWADVLLGALWLVQGIAVTRQVMDR